jgi:flagellar hook-length control protein FliK
MTMMSSLKAFLFASPAQGAMIGGAAVPSPGGEGGDFAALLGGIAQPPAASGSGSALPMPNPGLPVPTEGEARALPLDMQALPAVDPLAIPLGNMLPVETPPTDLRAPVHKEAPIFMGRPEVATAETETDGAALEAEDDVGQPKADASEAAPVAPVIGVPAPALPIVLPSGFASPPAALPAAPEAPEAKAAATLAVVGKGDKNVPGVSIPSSVPDLSVTPLPSPNVAQAVPHDGLPATRTARPARGNATGPALSGEAIAVDRPATTPQVTAPQSSQAALPVAPQALVTAPTAVAQPMAAPIIVSTAVRTAAKDPALSMPGGTPLVEMPVPNASAPVKSEALSLLQLVREHFVRREGGAATEATSPATVPRTADPVAADNAPAASLATLAPSQAIAPAPTPATGAIQAMPASVDLGGTIAGQVVDMGVQGQWIDGLAKDIASLSTEGAQGRFQIRSDHLGAVQVDIRPGATGTTVSLTVASDAAQHALQADGDRLIADAALVAMKITDLRVERGTINEAQRSDSAGQQQSGSSGSNSQSQGQNQGQNGSQAMGQGQGQGLSQGMGQNRSGHRDNFSGNHKSGPDSAVLPQADSREGEATGVRRAVSRARYA